MNVLNCQNTNCSVIAIVCQSILMFLCSEMTMFASKGVILIVVTNVTEPRRVKHVIGFSLFSFFSCVKSRSTSGFLVLIFHIIYLYIFIFK